jgi:hypothetical protein
VLKWRSSTSTEPVGHDNGINGVGIISLVLVKNVQRLLVQTILPGQDSLVSVDESLDDGNIGFSSAMLIG